MLFVFNYIFLRLAKQSQYIPLQNVVYFITLTFLVSKILTFYINDMLLFKRPFPGPKGQSKSMAWCMKDNVLNVSLNEDKITHIMHGRYNRKLNFNYKYLCFC